MQNYIKKTNKQTKCVKVNFFLFSTAYAPASYAVDCPCLVVLSAVEEPFHQLLYFLVVALNVMA